nr:LEAF RUST 10 DISEASE-RESISTANCE LOCUS RECEPTOR-LIKE PROTEIN KINASE-like 1.1 [Ipomoea batatas]
MAQPFIPRLFFLLPLIAFYFYFAHGEDESPLSNCPKEFTCGNIDSLQFPFAQHTQPHCGLVKVNCYTTPPTVQLGDWYQLQNVSTNGKTKTIFLEDSKLQRLFDRHDCSILNYTVQFQNSPSITFRYSESKATFLQCNNNRSSICNYERYSNCVEGLSLYYKRPYTAPENYGRCSSSVPASCALLPSPIIIDKPNALLTAQFGVEFQVSEACYECYYGGGRCTVDIHNQFQCEKGKSTMRTTMLKVILVTVTTKIQEITQEPTDRTLNPRVWRQDGTITGHRTTNWRLGATTETTNDGGDGGRETGNLLTSYVVAPNLAKFVLEMLTI